MEQRELAGQSPGTPGGRVVIFGLEVFAPKNRLQLETMAAYGYTYDVFVHDETEASCLAFAGLERLGHRLFVLPRTTQGVVRSARAVLRDRPHHLEFYTTDSRSLVVPLIARAAGIPLVTVERGLVSVIDQRPPWKRWALAGTYRLSDIVLFKEPHMASLIQNMAKGAHLEYVPNAVPPATRVTSFANRDIDFLWANRILENRYCEWLTEFAATDPPGHRRTVVAGLRPGSSVSPAERVKQDLVRRAASQSIDVLGWLDPHPLMLRARFFVMAAEHVFGNNALLEAMSVGCVPIVSSAPGVELLVKDRQNGMVVELSGRAFSQALLRALRLPESDWTPMSLAARQTIRTRYSPDSYGSRLLNLYRMICPEAQ